MGGSPTASGGISPYTYEWRSSYALNSSSSANPTASPSRSRRYIVTVTDLDHSTDKDTVEVDVDGFDLKTAIRFPVLADGNITVSDPLEVVGCVGTNGSISGTVTATDAVLVSTPAVALALRHLDTAIAKIDLLSASSISSTLNGNNYTSGIYRIAGNATLNGDLTLSGDENSFIVIDINGSLSISSGSEIILDGIRKDQVYFNVLTDVTITGTSTLNGHFLGRGNFTGTVIDGDLTVQIKGYISAILPKLLTDLEASAPGPPRQIENFFGFNAAVVLNNYGLGSDDEKYVDNTPDINPWLLRYPGGSEYPSGQLHLDRRPYAVIALLAKNL